MFPLIILFILLLLLTKTHIIFITFSAIVELVALFTVDVITFLNSAELSALTITSNIAEPSANGLITNIAVLCIRHYIHSG